MDRNIEKSIGKIFRHFKGDLYLVEGVVTHSESGEKMVLYRALYLSLRYLIAPIINAPLPQLTSAILSLSLGDI